MLARINTLLLTLILVTVLWVGFKAQRGRQAAPEAAIGRYVAFPDGDNNHAILDTATGEIYSISRIPVLNDPPVFTITGVNYPKHALHAEVLSLQMDKTKFVNEAKEAREATEALKTLKPTPPATPGAKNSK